MSGLQQFCTDIQLPYTDIWLCSHNMKSEITKSESEMGQFTKDYAFKLCQEVALPKSMATIKTPQWIPVSREFPNRWLTYGNAPHRTGNKSVIHSSALGINLNCGFVPDNYTVIPIHGIEEKCILVVHGKFYKSDVHFTVANIHGDWNQNSSNEKAVIKFIQYMKNYLQQYGGHFVLAGDFEFGSPSEFPKLRDEINKIMPNLCYPTLDNEITTFLVDHIITNIHVEKLTTFVDARVSDHLVLAFKIRLPYQVTPHSIANRSVIYVDPDSYQNIA